MAEYRLEGISEICLINKVNELDGILRIETNGLVTGGYTSPKMVNFNRFVKGHFFNDNGLLRLIFLEADYPFNSSDSLFEFYKLLGRDKSTKGYYYGQWSYSEKEMIYTKDKDTFLERVNSRRITIGSPAAICLSDPRLKILTYKK